MPHSKPAVLLAAACMLACGRVDDQRNRANETAAIVTIKTIHTAQTQYFAQFGRFAATLAELGPPASGPPSIQAADLIPANLTTGKKSGYSFELTTSPAGYVIRAEPVDPGPTKFYYSNQEMVIRANTGSRANENSPEVR
jgi:hypothetical protein